MLLSILYLLLFGASHISSLKYLKGIGILIDKQDKVDVTSQAYLYITIEDVSLTQQKNSRITREFFYDIGDKTLEFPLSFEIEYPQSLRNPEDSKSFLNITARLVDKQSYEILYITPKGLIIPKNYDPEDGIQLGFVEALDKTTIDRTRCNLPAETGMCKAYFPSYYFDVKEKSCKRFIYGGCGGNLNRFHTIEECLAYCSLDKIPAKRSNDICDHEKYVGPCEALIKRYFYNKTKNICEQFYYGGCNQNPNNFRTLEDCMNTCMS